MRCLFQDLNCNFSRYQLTCFHLFLTVSILCHFFGGRRRIISSHSSRTLASVTRSRAQFSCFEPLPTETSLRFDDDLDHESTAAVATDRNPFLGAIRRTWLLSHS